MPLAATHPPIRRKISRKCADLARSCDLLDPDRLHCHASLALARVTTTLPIVQVVAIHPIRPKGKKARLPLMQAGVAAGFPSPADDYIEKHIDLNDHLIANRAATFLVRARGDSMVNANIHDGNLLIVDRSIEAKDGDIIIAVVEGKLTVKSLRRKAGKTWLVAANEKYQPILVTDPEAIIWGVVRHWIHSKK